MVDNENENDDANKKDVDSENYQAEKVDTIEDDEKQKISYPNETLEKIQLDDESDGTDTEKISSSGNIDIKNR